MYPLRNKEKNELFSIPPSYLELCLWLSVTTFYKVLLIHTIAYILKYLFLLMVVTFYTLVFMVVTFAYCYSCYFLSIVVYGCHIIHIDLVGVVTYCLWLYFT